MIKTLIFTSLEKTIDSAFKLGELVKAGDVIALIGPLGAGKTTFTTGVAKGLQVPEQYRVTSPTYVYSQIYPGRIPLYHMDFYRIESEKHLRELGLLEMFGGDGVTLVEWYDRFPKFWNSDRLELHFQSEPDGARKIVTQCFGKRSEALHQAWASA